MVVGGEADGADGAQPKPSGWLRAPALLGWLAWL
jgi:hypothetical protein